MGKKHRLTRLDQKRLNSIMQRAAANNKSFAEKMQMETKDGVVKCKKLYYENLPELIDASKSNWREIVMATAAEDDVNWSTSTEATLCAILDQSTPEFRKKVYEYIKAAMPPTSIEAAEYPDMSTHNRERLFEYTHTCGSRHAVTAELMKELDLETMYYHRSFTSDENFIVFPLNLIHKLYTNFNVSPHWLLGLGETACVLANNIETELIMDYFCLLPETWKEIVAEGVRKASLKFSK